MLRFEEYLNQFTNTINIQDFVIALLTTAILAVVIRMYYIRYGEAVSNRRRFGNIFLPLALTTMLIITIVKSSIALSLGLVGALSIVRFRAAIKDPEELTYLFLVIGLGLATGANQFLVAFVAIPAILLLLWANQKLSGKETMSGSGSMYVNIETDSNDLQAVTKILGETLSFVELKRMDTLDNGLSLSYVVRAENLDQIDALRERMSSFSSKTSLSVIERPEIVV
jgi:uncharacterized membrane protein YhiD involved in acid resistance